MHHVYDDVPGLGRVVLSRHAQANLQRDGFGDDAVMQLLNKGARVDVEGGNVQLTHAGLRAVVVRRPTPYKGASLMVTAYRLELRVGERRR